MKVLVISTLYSGGGAEIQSKFEFDLLKNNKINTRYITFDPNLETGESVVTDHINLLGNYSKNYRRLSDLFRNKRVEKLLAKYIREYQPDIIHLHQIGFASKSIYSVLKTKLCVQTIHDYSIVCDKGTCILQNGLPCANGESSNCLNACYSSSFQTKIKYYYRHLVRRSIDKYRRACVDKFISPSECLVKYLKMKKYDAICINNAIDTSDYVLYKKKPFTRKRIVLYYGAIRKAKGTKLLVEAYEPEQMPNLQLHIIGGFDTGRIEDCYEENDFLRLVREKNIIFHGKKNHTDVIHFLEGVFAVIVPSMWMENYPTTAIEGIYGRCIICGSNRGGVPELISERRLMFDVMDSEDIKKCLLVLNDMTDSEYEDICNKQSEMFKRNNAPEIYFKRIMEVFERELAR